MNGIETLSLFDLFVEHVSWAKEVFPKATAQGALDHAARELVEIELELQKPELNSVAIITEYADAIGCILNSFTKAGYDMEDFKRAFRAKLIINKGRKWQDNGDGSYSHIKE